MSNWAAIGALGTAAEGAGNYFGIIAKEKIVSERLAEARANKLADVEEARESADGARLQGLKDADDARLQGIQDHLVVTGAANAEYDRRQVFSAGIADRNLVDEVSEVKPAHNRIGTTLKEGSDGLMYAQYVTDSGITYVLPVQNGKPSDLPPGAIPVPEGQNASDVINGETQNDIDPAYYKVDPAMQNVAQQLGGTKRSSDGNFKGKMSAPDQARQDDSLKLINAVGNMKKLMSPGEDGKPGYNPTGWQGYIDQLTAGGWTNFAASGPGQEFQREAIDASETLLRLATGAAAPEPEVERYRQLYVPEAGDSTNTVKAKMAGLDNMIHVLGGLKEQLDLGNITQQQYANAVEDGFLESSKSISAAGDTTQSSAGVGGRKARDGSSLAGNPGVSVEEEDEYLKSLGL